MAPLPLIKIVAVLFKEVSKPIAAYVKKSAVDHPQFKRVTISVGRGYEQLTQRIEMTFAGAKSGTALKPVTDSHALHVGADMISQGFLLSTAIGFVVLEYWRGLRLKEVTDQETAVRKAAKRAAEEKRHGALVDEARALAGRVAALEERLQSAEKALARRAGAQEREDAAPLPVDRTVGSTPWRLWW
jgi:hypothetical protein